MEEKVLKFWKENKIFEKTVEGRKDTPPQSPPQRGGEVKKSYSFYDGPPFATGLPHYGSIAASVIKDTVPRYWTMRGYKVERKWGWDCHGLPIENIVEKELGSKSKKDIEKLGVEKFNEACRGKVLSYADDWKKIIERLGRWADMKNSYKTMDLGYMESVWYVFKELWDEGLIYEGYKPMHICPRCETTLSHSEVAEGYKDVKDLSVIAKFRIVEDVENVLNVKNEQNDRASEAMQQGVSRSNNFNKALADPTYILAWTTTPWTLIGNAALAINPDIDYVKAKLCHSRENGNPDPRVKPEDDKKRSSEKDKKNDEYYILAKDRLGDILKDESYEIVEEFKGKDLIGKKYKPLFDYYTNSQYKSALSPHESALWENGWKIYGADFVATEEGTGVVHIAPAFGEDDMELGKKENLPFIQHIGMDGVIKKEIKGLAGLSVKPMTEEKDSHQKTDVEIIKYLARRNLLFSKEKYEHSYPHCWRCETPLINYATSSWFVNVSKIKKQALKLAKEINWSPSHIKKGRFGNWLESAHDWSISRQRFWASVIPVWVCEKCGEKKVIGLVEEVNKNLGAFFAMRHGEAESNIKDVISCEPGDGYFLTEKGVKDVKKVAKELKKEKIEIIISSDLDRTKQTAEIMAEELGVKIIFDKRIREVNAGDSNGKKLSDLRIIREKWWKGINAKFPNGDDFISLKERIEPFYNEVFRKYRDKKVLIVSHGAILMSLEAILSEGDYLDEMKNIFLNKYFEKAELRKLDYKLINLHKHIVDGITFKCEKCGGIMKRVPDVLDCWFESGAMPYAQMHYPFENKEKFEESFPADFIAEGIDQTRTWFYYLHIIATAIKNKPAFKNVIVNGIVLAEDGKKMSKRLKNYPDPMLMFNKYGADTVRFYLLSSPVVSAQNLNFSEKELAELARGMFRMLWNSYYFFVLYANIDKVKSQKSKVKSKELRNLLDRWIVSELNMLIKKVNGHMENYELHKAARLFPEFVDNLSNWYIRRSRKRFWKSENDEDKNQAYQTLHYVLTELSKLLAPFAPFVAEEIYRNLAVVQNVQVVENVQNTEDKRSDTTTSTSGAIQHFQQSSVHLENFPQADEKLINEELNKNMSDLREIVTLGLQNRSKNNIKVRQPLRCVVLGQKYARVFDETINKPEWSSILTEELNVRGVELGVKNETVEIDTEITKDLKLEGQAREIIRCIQQMRKEADFEVDNRIEICYSGASEVFRKFGDMIAKETLAEKISSQPTAPASPAGKHSSRFDLEKEFEIDKDKIKIQIRKN